MYIAGMLDDMGKGPDQVLIGGDIQLSRAALENADLKSRITEHSLDIHISKNDSRPILLKSLACRRYKL